MKLRSHCFGRFAGRLAPLLLLLVRPGFLSAQEDIVLGYHLTSWLEAGAEARLREESQGLLVGGDEDTTSALFSRVRAALRASVRDWLHITAEFQDSRTLAGPSELRETRDNRGDLLYGFVDLGWEKEGPWRIRAGRQPLAFGDERLVGADSSWDNRSQRFDGVRATLQHNRWHWDLFSVTPTEVVWNAPDNFTSRERMTGAYGSWSANLIVIEPYLLWNRISTTRSNLVTPGFRIAAHAAARTDVVIETALQRGAVSDASVSAMAAYFEIGYRTGQAQSAPRLVMSYSYASGDQDANDHKIGTFNDLHPAGYNECGFLEPFSWRNIRDLRAGATLNKGKWHVVANLHSYWLATLHDGVYVDEGPYIAFDPAARSARLGFRLLAMTSHPLSRHADFALGCAKFFAAEYLREFTALSHEAFGSVTFRL